MINKSKTILRIDDCFGSGLMYDLKNKKIIEQYLVINLCQINEKRIKEL
jgi:hypothetical protein